MVLIIGTTVWSEKYGPVWKIRSGLENTVRSGKYGPVSSLKIETVKGTGPYGLALWDRSPVQSMEIVGPDRTVRSQTGL